MHMVRKKIIFTYIDGATKTVYMDEKKTQKYLMERVKELGVVDVQIETTTKFPGGEHDAL